jgi:hypothetical protein
MASMGCEWRVVERVVYPVVEWVVNAEAGGRC